MWSPGSDGHKMEGPTGGTEAEHSSWVGIWELWVVQKPTGKLGQTQTRLPRDDSSQRRGLQLMVHTQHVVCFDWATTMVIGLYIVCEVSLLH